MTDLQTRLAAALGSSYRIERELPGGGMSRVFLATEVELGRSVVVKVLPPEMGAGVNIDRFRREIQLAAKLQHPHIVPLLTAGASGDLLYYIMPYIEGESLRAKLEREVELPVGEAVRILREVVDALDYAHSQGIVHRDIKPENILFSRKHALVTDFGVAKAVAESGKGGMTSIGVALGTPAYMAPEQASADPHTDHRADLYAVGAVAYELLSGRPPFSGPNPQAILAAHVTQAPEPIGAYRPNLPAPLATAVMRCLEKRAADRWQSAEQLGATLETMLTPSGGITPTGTQPYDAVTLARTQRVAHPGRVALLFGLGAIAALGIVYALMLALGLPDWVLVGAAALLLLGFPVMLMAGHAEKERAVTQVTGAVRSGGGGWRGWLTWRRAILGGLVAFAGLALVTGGYAVMRALGVGPAATLMTAGTLGAEDRLVLADFKNRTADSLLGESVTEALRIDLSQSTLVKLLDESTIQLALQRMEKSAATPVDDSIAREIAEREGAKALLVGEISNLGQGYVVSGKLIGARDGAVLVALRETADDNGEIIKAVDALSRNLRAKIGESLRSIRATERLDLVSTASLKALRLYRQSNDAINDGDIDRGLRLLQAAVAEDSTFAMAWRRIAVVIGNSGGDEEAASEAATRAFELRDRLPERERNLAEAYYYSSVDFDADKAEQAYRLLIERYPDEGAALNNLALWLNFTERFVEAEQYARQALTTGVHWPFYANLLTAQMGQGNYAGALETVESFETRNPGSPHATRWRGWIAGNQRDFVAAESLDKVLMANPEPIFRYWGTQTIAGTYEIKGRIGDALDAHERLRRMEGIRENPGGVLREAAAAALLRVRYRADTAGAIRGLTRALENTRLDSLPARSRPYPELALAYAVAGEVAEARRLMADYERLVPEGTRKAHGERFSARGGIAMAEGRYAQAAEEFRTAHESGTCFWCGEFPLALAYDRQGNTDSAAAILERAINQQGAFHFTRDAPWLGFGYKRLGELYEDRDPQKALDNYHKFLDLWHAADPELQPAVEEVRGRVAKLSGEPGS